MVAELAQAAAQIAQHELLVAGHEFDAARISAVASPDRESKVGLDEMVDRLCVLELVPARREQRFVNFGANAAKADCDRQRTAGPPETDYHDWFFGADL